jgi:hypothetical protein
MKQRPSLIPFLLGCYGLVELASLLILVSASLSDADYSSLSRDRLTAKGRASVERMIRYYADPASYFVFDPVQGWSIRPGSSNKEYRANSAGIRGDRDYDPVPARDHLRISAFGGSFTHGDEVSNADTWESQLERLDPSIEALNFGVTAFGPDQAYLRYLAYEKRFAPRIVLIGLMSEDVDRAVNTFRPFYFPPELVPRAKPRFRVENGALSPIPNPFPDEAGYRRLLEHPESELPRIGAADAWWALLPERGPMDFLPSVRLAKTVSYWLRRSFAVTVNPLSPSASYRPGEALATTEAIFSEFYSRVEKDGRLPVIALFPSYDDVRKFRRTGKRTYQPLLDYLKSRKMRNLDFLDALAAGELSSDRAHYGPAENARIASALQSYLSEQKLTRR